jgi:hypothetical protein
MFSINTNNSAMAALQSLQATNTALSQTQNEVSTGLKVSSAADNPAVYAISQAMDANIAGLTAVQDGLSFGAQVVGTASTATSSISSTLNTLKQTITQGLQQGLSAAQMNGSITSALAQIDTFANSATFNGVNLVSGAVGANVQSTSLQVLSDTQGDGFAVGAERDIGRTRPDSLDERGPVQSRHQRSRDNHDPYWRTEPYGPERKLRRHGDFAEPWPAVYLRTERRIGGSDVCPHCRKTGGWGSRRDAGSRQREHIHLVCDGVRLKRERDPAGQRHQCQRGAGIRTDDPGRADHGHQ